MRMCMSTCIRTSLLLHCHTHLLPYYVYICLDYSVMTPYILYTPIIIRLCVPAPRGWPRYCHNYHSVFKGLCFSIYPCLRFLWIHTYHRQIKIVQFCVHLPLPYVRSSTMSLSVFIPITWKRAHVKMLTQRLFKTHKKNTCEQMNAKWNIKLCLHTYAYTMNINQQDSHNNNFNVYMDTYTYNEITKINKNKT